MAEFEREIQDSKVNKGLRESGSKLSLSTELVGGKMSPIEPHATLLNLRDEHRTLDSAVLSKGPDFTIAPNSIRFRRVIPQ